MSDHPDARDGRPSIIPLVEVMARLRGPGGCPWDQEQTHTSLSRWLVEETWECVDAIAAGDDGELRDELGDVLLQVVFHARIAEERGAFALQDVVDGITAKMVRRHPHVFGEAEATNSGDVHRIWEDIKAAERREDADAVLPLAGRLARVPRGLPPLERARKVGGAAAREGLDWPDIGGVLAKVREEVDELEEAVAEEPERVEEELGDLLLALTSVARHAGVSCTNALVRALHKFEQRARMTEELAHEAGAPLSDLDSARVDALWTRAREACAVPAAQGPPAGRAIDGRGDEE